MPIVPKSVTVDPLSLVNLITPYAFLKSALSEGHWGAIATAGHSATGRALMGLGLQYEFPVISVVRSESASFKSVPSLRMSC